MRYCPDVNGRTGQWGHSSESWSSIEKETYTSGQPETTNKETEPTKNKKKGKGKTNARKKKFPKKNCNRNAKKTPTEWSNGTNQKEQKERVLPALVRKKGVVQEEGGKGGEKKKKKAG